MRTDRAQPNIYMNITNDPTFEVHIPASQSIIWPNNCSLCCSPIVEQKKTIAHEVQSGEYLIAETYRHYVMKDIPYCSKCYNKTILTIGEKYSIIVSIIIGTIIAGLIIIYNMELICLAIIVFAVIFILSLLNFQFFLKKKSEKDSIDFELIVDSKFLGKQDSIALKVKFRNREFAHLFVKLNKLFGQHVCNYCRCNLLFNFESSNWYCLNCSNN